jgi:transposase-like protein
MAYDVVTMAFSIEARFLNGRKCPVCGSEFYIETYADSSSDDDHAMPEKYQCSGCSTVFVDPFRFGEAGRKKSENEEGP